MEIKPPSARREAASVLRLAALILAATWIYLANTSVPRAGAVARPNLDSFQKLFRDLSPAEQRQFRALREGLLEIENLRSATGSWPKPEALAEQGIPPFAADPIEKETYRWSSYHEGILVNYLGLPASPGGEAYLLFLQEPTPGVPPDRAPNDEEHHRLPNGDVLHVSVWRHGDGGRVPAAFVGLPEADGWTQLLAGAAMPAAAN